MQADLRIFAPHIRTAERKLLKTGNIFSTRCVAPPFFAAIAS
jgi:hypothetical protein